MARKRMEDEDDELETDARQRWTSSTADACALRDSIYRLQHFINILKTKQDQKISPENVSTYKGFQCCENKS